jgi:hypothetical protein
MSIGKLGLFTRSVMTGAVFFLYTGWVDAQEITKPTVPMRNDVLSRCLATYLVPRFFLKGDGMVGTDNNATTGCDVIYYYLTDPNLSPDEASKSVEFSFYAMSLDNTLDAENVQYIRRDSKGRLRPGEGMDFNTGICPNIDRYIVSGITGENWHGWIVESVFRKPTSKRVGKY